MSLLYEVPDYKKIRVIIDTDAACEADDPFAIAHALMCRKLEVKAIFAEQFGAPETTRCSYDEILTVLEAMDLEVPVFMGEEGTLSDVKGEEISPAAKFLTEEAQRVEERPLFVLCLGAITNIASAIKACPEITKNMTVVWIGVVLEPNCGQYVYREAPIFEEDTTYRFESGRPMIRVYTSINSRFILEDFIGKLELLYGRQT